MRALLFMEVTVIKVRQYGIVGQVIFKGVRSLLSFMQIAKGGRSDFSLLFETTSQKSNLKFCLVQVGMGKKFVESLLSETCDPTLLHLAAKSQWDSKT